MRQGVAPDLRRYVRLLRQDELAGWAAVAKDLRALGLDRTEAAEVRAQIQSLTPLARARERSIRRAVDRKHHHDREPRPCKTCKRMLPHTPEDYRKHMKIMRSYRWWLLSPIGKPGCPGPYECRERGLQRRARAFAEEAPQAARVLGPAGVRAIVEQVSNKWWYKDFRRWVQIQYGGKPAKAGKKSKPVGQIRAPKMKIPWPNPYPPYIAKNKYPRKPRASRSKRVLSENA